MDVVRSSREMQMKLYNFAINSSIDVSVSQFLSIDPNPDFDWEIAIEELANPNDLLLGNILRTVIGPITSLLDSNGSSLLHHSVLKQTAGKTKFLIDFARLQQQIPNEIILTWINQPTQGEGWTALHYASFQGNIDAIYTLIENKANCFSTNSNGLTMLHVAAQGDTAPPLYIFKMLGININQ